MCLTVLPAYAARGRTVFLRGVHRADSKPVSLPVRDGCRDSASATSVDGCRVATNRRTVGHMWTVLIILLVAWAVLSVVGFAIKGLFWLAVIGIILFVGTVVFGLVRNRERKL